MGDFNVALVIVAAVVSVLMLLVSVYLLVNYQHPDDANQAYFPKLFVVLGITVAVHTTLSAKSYSALAALYDDLLLQAASWGAATDDWPYAVHLLAHLFLNDLRPWGHAMCRSRGLETPWSRANGRASMRLEACRQRRQCVFLSKSWRRKIVDGILGSLSSTPNLL